MEANKLKEKFKEEGVISTCELIKLPKMEENAIGSNDNIDHVMSLALMTIINEAKDESDLIKKLWDARSWLEYEIEPLVNEIYPEAEDTYLRGEDSDYTRIKVD